MPSLENQIISIKTYLFQIDENAKNEREKISMIYNEVRMKLIEHFVSVSTCQGNVEFAVNR